MKRVKVSIILLVLVAMLVLNLVALFSSAGGVKSEPKCIVFGKFIYQNGQIVGCACPCIIGSCTCIMPDGKPI